MPPPPATDMARFDIRPAGDGRFLWRLLSGNNRTIATAAGRCDSRAECAAQFQRAGAAAAERRPRLVHEDDGTWSWTLDDADGEPVARSAVTYSRRIDCVHAIDRFAELARAAAQAARPAAAGRARTPRR